MTRWYELLTLIDRFELRSLYSRISLKYSLAYFIDLLAMPTVDNMVGVRQTNKIV